MTEIKISTSEEIDIIDITEKIHLFIYESKKESGLVHIFLKHTTASLTISEYEPGIIKDLKNFFKKLVPKNNPYLHNELNHDDNAHSHILSTINKQELTIPFKNNSLELGTWQKICLVDFDTQSRERKIELTIIN